MTELLLPSVSAASRAASISTDRAAVIEQAAADATAADAALRTVLRELACATPLPPLDLPALQELDRTRRAALTHYGEALLDWQRNGGAVTLTPAQAEPGEAEAPLDHPARQPSRPQIGWDSDACPETGFSDAPHPEASIEADPPAPPPALPASASAAHAPPPPRPASLASLAALKDGFGQAMADAAEPKVHVTTSVDTSLPGRLGKPGPVHTVQDWLTELTRLESELHRSATWSTARGEGRRELLCLLAARARHLQDECTVPAGADERLYRVFSRLVVRMNDGPQVGFVLGLSRSQRPSQGSWLADARIWWRKLTQRTGWRPTETDPEALLDALRRELDDGLEDAALVDRVETLVAAGLSSNDPRLVTLVSPRASAFDHQPRCKTLKTVLRAQRQAEDVQEQTADARLPDLPEALLAQTRGRRAILVGGDRRNSAADRIRVAFDFSECEWESGHQVRRLDSLATRIRHGGVDVVIFLKRFLSHRVTDILLPALKANPAVQGVWVEQGYGVGAVAKAILPPAKTSAPAETTGGGRT